MKHRPFIITIVAWALLLTPVWISLQIIISYPIPLNYLHALFTPELWHWQIVAAMVVSVITGIAVWTVHSWGYYTLLAWLGLVTVNNIVIWASDLASSSLLVRLVMVAGLGFVAITATKKEFKAPYFNPRLRWWEQAQRFEAGNFTITVWEYGRTKVLFETKAFDLSIKGAYISTDFVVSLRQNLCLDIHIPDGSVVKATAEVVRVQNQPGPHQGFGCRFIAFEPDFVPSLEPALKHLAHQMANR